MYFISITFDEKKIPDHYFRNIHKNKCAYYAIHDDFLVVTDTEGVLHYYRKEYILSFHIEEVKYED